MNINVYVLSSADYERICEINRDYPSGPQIIICDHGLGPCVEETTINDVAYVEWRNALDLLEPFSSRTIQVIEIDNY
jgi:hypothetical protein